MRNAGASDRDDKIYEAAWLHYQCHLAQKEVARRLRVDKATVSRWLSEAVDRGIVSVSLKPPGIKELELRLCQSFNLSRARVIPSLSVVSNALRGETEFTNEHASALRSEELGKAAAAFIGPTLRGNTGIGLGGGTSVAAFARYLGEHCPAVGLKLFALSVSSREPFAICATSVTAIATSLLMSEFRQRAATGLHRKQGQVAIPKIEGHALRLPERSKDLLGILAAADAYYDEAMAQIELIVTGIGAIETCWVLNEKERAELKELGAVGDILYDIFGERGTPIKADPAALVFPFSIARLRKMVSQGKEVVVICANKIEAISHALNANQEQFITGIVTDEHTARETLDYAAKL